jgi:dipeptidyl-peptidase-4
MEWSPDNKELIIQHLNRRQNISRLMLCNSTTGAERTIYTEKDTAWINIQSFWDDNYKMGGWDWLDHGKSFLWVSEKDGWRHLYKVSRDGKSEIQLKTGLYDVMGIEGIDENEGYVYFMASPDNATQAYLYRTKLDGTGEAALLTPSNQAGTSTYDIAPGAKYALHVFSNYYTYFVYEYITLPDHKGVNGENIVNDRLGKEDKSKSNITYFKIKTPAGIEMDAWKVMPAKFDSSKKYPVVFYVYSGGAAQTVIDSYGATRNFVYNGDMANDGYIYISIDNRGTPAPKGAAWRKVVYRKMGRLDIADQAAAAREICKWPYVDTSRIAVWGWSNGGAATLNLLFQYPDIYKTGIAIAPITNYLYYDNIWMEHVMGFPQNNKQDYLAGSPITYAKNLKGNLFFIHGSGDDNVHFKNAELLLNELISDNKVFQFMEYPNRSHDIVEGLGTTKNLSNLYTIYLKEHCPGGPK